VTDAAEAAQPWHRGAYPYMTNAGERWCWKATMTVNGRRKPVNRRGYQSNGDALAAMREAVVKAARGEKWDRPARLAAPRVQPGGDDDLHAGYGRYPRRSGSRTSGALRRSSTTGIMTALSAAGAMPR